MHYISISWVHMIFPGFPKKLTFRYISHYAIFAMLLSNRRKLFLMVKQTQRQEWQASAGKICISSSIITILPTALPNFESNVLLFLQSVQAYFNSKASNNMKPEMALCGIFEATGSELGALQTGLLTISRHRLRQSELFLRQTYLQRKFDHG